MKIYTGYPGGITKITNDKGFYQTEDLVNVISVYVNQADVTGITYTLALEFLRADGRKTTIYTEDRFASGEATTLTEENVTYDIHNFTLTNTQLAVAGALAFTCYINILNSGVVEKRGVLFNAVSNVRKTVTYSANTIFVVSEDDEDVPIIVADMKTAIETLSGQLASKVNKADIADNLTTNDSSKVLSAKQGKVLKDTIDGVQEELDSIQALENLNNIVGTYAELEALITIGEATEYQLNAKVQVLNDSTHDNNSTLYNLDSLDIENGLVQNYIWRFVGYYDGYNKEQIDEIINDFEQSVTDNFNELSGQLEGALTEQDEKIESLGTLQPSGADTTEHITNKTAPDGIWISTTDGHWYYWDGTQYVDGGVYQATELPDDVVSIDGSQLKDQNGNNVYPKVNGDSIPIDYTMKSYDFNYSNLITAYNMEYGHWASDGGATGTTQYVRTVNQISFKKNVKYRITVSSTFSGNFVAIKPYENGQVMGSATTLTKGQIIDYTGTYDWRLYIYDSTSTLTPSQAVNIVTVVDLSFDFDNIKDTITTISNNLNTFAYKNLIGNSDFEYGHWASNGGATGTTQFIRTKSNVTFEKGVLYRITFLKSAPFGTMTLRPYENGQLVGSVVQLGKNQTITFVGNYDWRLYAYIGSTQVDFSLIHNYFIIEKVETQKTFFVGSNRAFTRLRDGVAEAIKYPNSIVYVDSGTYDLLDEFSTEITNDLTSQYGIKLENGVHLIFSSGAKVTANYNGSSVNVANYFSPFYLGDVNYNFLNDDRVNPIKGFTLENLDISAGNVRYCVHDEGGEINSKVTTKYISCRMTRTADGTSYIQCIGGGCAKNHYVYIENCYFNSEAISELSPLVSYHNNGNSNISNAQSNIFISNCYFGENGTFRVTYHGTSTLLSKAYCNNNSLAGNPIIKHEVATDTDKPENFELISYNNEVRS